MIKNLIFDFDGVLVESVNAKTQAFKELYKEFGLDVVQKVEEFHLANGGVSRYEKIKYFHQNYLGMSITQTELSGWSNRFSDIVLNQVINAKNVIGAEQFLEKYSNSYSCWIITGTPIEEIKYIIKQKKWEKYFIDVLGSPHNKIYWSEYLIQNNNINPSETIFIGDALTDLEAANHSGFNFILRKTEENERLFKNYEGKELNDLCKLNEVIKAI